MLNTMTLKNATTSARTQIPALFTISSLSHLKNFIFLSSLSDVLFAPGLRREVFPIVFLQHRPQHVIVGIAGDFSLLDDGDNARLF